MWEIRKVLDKGGYHSKPYGYKAFKGKARIGRQGLLERQDCSLLVLDFDMTQASYEL